MMRLLGLWTLYLPLVAWTQAAPPADSSDAYRKLLTQLEPNIVTIQAVVRFESKGEEQNESAERKIVLQGAVLTADGLIMTSGVLLSSESYKILFGLEDDEEQPVTLTPQSFKVIFGSEPQEREAQLVATDSKLGLAFLKVKDLGGRTFKPLPLAATDPAVGTEIAVLSRLPRGFDFAPYFTPARIIGEIAKPRKAMLLDINVRELGLPAFNMNGEVVGVVVLVRQETGDEEEFNFGFQSKFGGSGVTAFVAPVSALKPLIEQAVQRATSAP
ncbi:MAG: serine protease [Fimbriimonadales bacterium]|nr:serine protease [Fimbriimonadales bacterium]